MRKSPFLPLLIFLAASCGGGDSAASGSSATVTDSAGVRIVMNTSPVLSPGDGWRVDPEPVVKLGDEANEPPEETFGRIAGLFVLSNNEVLVVDMETAQLRYFGLDGRFLRAKGRRGNGPGEHAWIARAWRMRGDTLLLWGGGTNLSWLTGEGDFLSSVLPADVRPEVVSVFHDGELISQPKSPSEMQAFAPSGSGPHVLHQEYLSADRHGNGKVRFGPWPVFVDEPPGRRQRYTPRRYHAAMELYYTARSSEYDIQGFTRSGEQRISIRRAVAPAAVTPLESEEFFTVALASALRDGGNAEAQRWYLGATKPAQLHPVLSGLMVDRSEHIWVRDYRVREDGILAGAPFESEAGAPQVWQIFTPDGVWLTSVEVPHRLWITDIGESHIAGVWRDENFTESARVYRLHRK